MDVESQYEHEEPGMDDNRPNYQSATPTYSIVPPSLLRDDQAATYTRPIIKINLLIFLQFCAALFSCGGI